MTDLSIEHLKEQLRAYYPDGFFLVGVRDGELEDPIMDYDNPMQGNFLEHGVMDSYVRTWGIPDNLAVNYEEIAFEPDGDWVEEED
tara:strand:- start:1527 stop:1784 length:258 start_codon:yes stop_codon:yes gene_type:complete